ncbi:hypothetical protein ACFCZ1_27765 [Streptomyces sp. NPDC056224]|uniref:hypothetical protein n=1 Tax=Streptomyces sp. NPDC056224 TaxID=3345750 RepID=UPI0035DEF8AE
MDPGVGAQPVACVVGGVAEPVQQGGTLLDGVVAYVGEDVTAVVADGDHRHHRVRVRQFLVARVERRAGIRPAVVVVRRVEPEVAAQAALAVVEPPHLPAGPGAPQQLQGGRPGAQACGGTFLGEGQQEPAGGVDEDSGLDGVVRVSPLLPAVPGQEGQDHLGPGEQVEVQSDRSVGGTVAHRPVGADDHEGGAVAHGQSPAASRRAAAVFEAS